MKKVALSLTLALALGLGAFAKNDADPVLMTVNNKPVKLSEFKYLYEKNNAQQSAIQPVDEYVDMFVTYKLKVADAEAAGIDTTATFQNEYLGYRRSLAEPYLVDNDAREELIHEIYDRLNEEVDVSHIMIDRKAGTPEYDAQRAYLDSIRSEIVAGRADFAAVANEISIDPATQRNHNDGRMGFISACRFPYTFEDAAYSTPVGQISPVIETPFGFHIVKVNGRRHAKGQVLAQHILKLTANLSPEEQAAKKAQIDSIYNLLRAGADFDQIATVESEDPGSARNGGRLGWFGVGQMVPEFEEAAFSLENGQVSEPFSTRFGYHIVKRLDWKGLEDYETLYPRIEQVIARDERQNIPVRAKTAQLREKYSTTIDNAVVDALRSQIAANGLDSLSVAALKVDNRQIVTLAGGNGAATVADIFSVLPSHYAAMTPSDALKMFDQRLDQVADETTVEAERTNLVAENADYRNLLNEYRDGMLLFEISDRNVWSKSKNDPRGIQDYFDANRAKYATWTAPKFKGYIVFATSDSIMRLAQDYLIANEIANDQVAEKLRAKFGRDIKVERVLAAKGENAIIDGIAFGGQRPEPSSKWVAYFPYAHSVIDQPEEIADERGAITADYQAQLEQEWVAGLRQRYPVKIDKKVLKRFKEQSAR